MKRNCTRWLARLAVGLASWSVCLVAQADDALAMIADCAGDARIEEHGTQSGCEILHYLNAGAALVLGDSGTVKLVYFASAKEYTFAGPGHVSIESGEPRAEGVGLTEPARDLAMVRDTGLVPSQSLAQAAIVMRGGEGDGDALRIIEPRHTAVREARPVLRWSPVEGAAHYRVALFDESGGVLWETEAEASELPVPDRIGIIPGECYTWRVAHHRDPAVNDEAEFFVLEPEVVRTLDSFRPGSDARFSDRVLYGLLLEELHLRAEARRHWADLSAERPQDPGLARCAQP